MLSGEQSGPSSRELLTPKTPDPSFQVDSDRKVCCILYSYAFIYTCLHALHTALPLMGHSGGSDYYFLILCCGILLITNVAEIAELIVCTCKFVKKMYYCCFFFSFFCDA